MVVTAGPRLAAAHEGFLIATLIATRFLSRRRRDHGETALFVFLFLSAPSVPWCLRESPSIAARLRLWLGAATKGWVKGRLPIERIKGSTAVHGRGVGS
jgi:hypothetical protein